MRSDNWGAGPDPNAPAVPVPVIAHPESATVFGRAVEIQAEVNKRYGEFLDHVAEVGRKYTPEARREVVANLLPKFQEEPIWQQAQDAEAEVERRVAELAQQVDNERRA